MDENGLLLKLRDDQATEICKIQACLCTYCMKPIITITCWQCLHCLYKFVQKIQKCSFANKLKLGILCNFLMFLVCIFYSRASFLFRLLLLPSARTVSESFRIGLKTCRNQWPGSKMSSTLEKWNAENYITQFRS